MCVWKIIQDFVEFADERHALTISLLLAHSRLRVHGHFVQRKQRSRVLNNAVVSLHTSSSIGQRYVDAIDSLFVPERTKTVLIRNGKKYILYSQFPVDPLRGQPFEC